MCAEGGGGGEPHDTEGDNKKLASYYRRTFYMVSRLEVGRLDTKLPECAGLVIMM